MKSRVHLSKLLALAVFLTVSCTPRAAIPTSVDVEMAVKTLPTETTLPSPSPTALPTLVATQPAPIPTDTLVPTPTQVLAFIGTPLPTRAEPISKSNFANLKKSGQWGRGSIQGVSFTPDGKFFIAISEMGWSIYDMAALDQPPRWVSFYRPLLFDDFYFSKDGNLVKFVYKADDNTITQFNRFPTAEIQEQANGVEWLEPVGFSDNRSVKVWSPDGTRVFSGELDYVDFFDESINSEEKSVRSMYNNNGQLLYDLRDAATYVTYSDRNGPEGCDLSVFSPCGNALMDLATTPVKALFSSDGATFAALYDPPSLYSGIMRAFSYVRIYDSSNGDLIGSLGGFSKPVQDFAYSPDGKLLLVGFVDGSLVLWDIKGEKTVLGTRHMNAPAWKLIYSPDSKYLLIQRGDELEVRMTNSGALLYRYEMAEFAISPLRNWIALGDDKGNIQVRDLDTGKSILNIEAHNNRIYSLAFSPDGLYLASSARDCDIKLWDLQTGKLLHYFEETAVQAYQDYDIPPSRIFSTYLEFIPGKNMLVGFGSWGTVVNWNVDSGATNYVIRSDALEYYNGIVTLKPHFPEYFDVDTTNNKFYINENGFDMNTGESLGAYIPPANLPEGCSPVGPVSIDKQLMFTRGYASHEGEICILDSASLALLGEVRVMPKDTNIEWVDWLYLSPDGRQLIVTVGSGIVYVYQIVQ